MGNGRVIGKDNLPAADKASGVWTLATAAISKLAARWPRLRGVFWNEADTHADISLSNANLTATKNTASAWRSTRADLSRSSGKRYFEVKIDAYPTTDGHLIGVGTTEAALTSYVGSSTSGWGYYSTTGKKWHNAVTETFGSSYGVGAVIGVAVDIDAGKIWWSRNGSWQASGDPANGTNAAYTNLAGLSLFPMYSLYNTNDEGTARFIVDDLTYSPPSGFAAWDG